MKKFLLGIAGLVALAAPASAADLAARPYKAPPPMIAAIYDWSGFYIGANGGWGSAHKCWDRNTGIGGVFLASEGCHDATGAVAGGQLGYRWQTSAWVFGVEIQGDWADLRGSNASAVTPFLANRTRVDGFGLFTGQVGYAINNVLLYVKGGGAVVSDRYRGYSTITGATLDTNDDTRWGGVAGVGLEYGFAPNWSAAIAYDHLFMGNRTRDFTAAVAPFGFSREDRIKQDVDLVTVRVNYRWGGPVVAKY
ncbi:MAG TPA: outer membrane beta-barrel protein [Bradyrhizobium sp.]|nr:outer membrane beta-barrel protein [Bradyrhizobium sp.]